VGVCPFCNARLDVVAPPPRAAAEPAALAPPPTFEPTKGAPLLASEPLRPMHPALHGLLFFLALPALVPGLVIAWIMAKRWGRVPLVFIVVDAFLMLLATLAYPRLVVVNVLAIGSLLFLYLRRTWEGRAAGGIVLGYSNLVVLPTILGGVLAFGGLFTTFPARWVSGEESLEARPVTAHELGDEGIRPGTYVRLRSFREGPQRLYFSSGRFTVEPPAGASETWVPIEDTFDHAWVVVPTHDAALPVPLEGIYERCDDGVVSALGEAIAERRGGVVFTGAGTIRIASEDEARADRRARQGPDVAPVRPEGAWPLGIGVLFLLLATLVAVWEGRAT
jgi:hypothetical protein